MICLEVPNTDDDGVLEERRRGGRRTHVCEVCDKDFRDACDLARHNLIPTGEKPFKCKVCARAFTLQGDLTRHARVHTGIQRFKCDCGKAYKSGNGLLYHKRTHKH